MWIAVMNNLPELILGLTWTVVVFIVGMKFQAWKNRKSRR